MFKAKVIITINQNPTTTIANGTDIHSPNVLIEKKKGGDGTMEI